MIFKYIGENMAAVSTSSPIRDVHNRVREELSLPQKTDFSGSTINKTLEVFAKVSSQTLMPADVKQLSDVNSIQMRIKKRKHNIELQSHLESGRRLLKAYENYPTTPKMPSVRLYAYRQLQQAKFIIERLHDTHKNEGIYTDANMAECLAFKRNSDDLLQRLDPDSKKEETKKPVP